MTEKTKKINYKKSALLHLESKIPGFNKFDKNQKLKKMVNFLKKFPNYKSKDDLED